MNVKNNNGKEEPHLLGQHPNGGGGFGAPGGGGAAWLGCGGGGAPWALDVGQHGDDAEAAGGDDGGGGGVGRRRRHCSNAPVRLGGAGDSAMDVLVAALVGRPGPPTHAAKRKRRHNLII